MKRFSVLIIICVLLAGIFALCACGPPSEPKPFPPPEGYSSWDEYREAQRAPAPPPEPTPPPPSEPIAKPPLEPKPAPKPPPKPELELSASFRIKHWQQDYYEYLEEWGFVEIYYEVENTGDLDIDYYEVYFIVECKRGEEYYGWDNGVNVGVGRKFSDHTIINTGGYEAKSVEIDDWELNPF